MHNTFSAYVKSYDRETQCIHLFIEDYYLLEIHNNIWNWAKNSIKKRT